jgi:general stress protein 26
MFDTDRSQLSAMIGGFDYAMLVTHSESGDLRARPMAIAGCSDDGRLWFITSADSTKLDELTENSTCNVCCQDGKRFLSISGIAKTRRDSKMIRQLWTPEQRVWFDEGLRDPNVIVLEIMPTSAEYWDRKGIEGIKFLFAEARALLTGGTLEGEENLHTKIKKP